MKKLKIVLIPIICHFSLSIYSQSRGLDTTFFSNIDTEAGFYYVKKNINATKIEAIEKIKSTFGLNETHNFIETKSEINENNNFFKYQHYFNNIIVEGSEINLYSNSKGIHTINGFIADKFNSILSINITSTQAISSATNSVKASIYMWQDSISENSLKEGTNNKNATYYPTSELTYICDNNSNYFLTYKVLVCSLKPQSKEYVYINPFDGAIIKRVDLMQSCNIVNKNKNNINTKSFPPCSGTCQSGQTKTLFYGDQAISTGKYLFQGDCKYRLFDECNPTKIRTVNEIQVSNNSNSNPEWEFTDQNNYFAFVDLISGGTAHWCAKMTTQYFRNNFSFEGMNGNATNNNPFNLKLNLDYTVCLGLDANNTCTLSNGEYANYDLTTDEINLGNGLGGIVSNNHWISLDLIGHEYTHGVVKYSSNLTFSGESGALNESFSDIFGSMIEYYAKSIHSANGTGNYLICEDFYTANGGFLRSLSNPSLANQPFYYQGPLWANTQMPFDNGGVHINSGVQNLWFYLLAEGGSEPQRVINQVTFPAYCIKGIGKDKAMKIAFENLRHLQSNANFAAARAGSIAEAVLLYGANSDEVAQCTQAWFAVGVGAAYAGSIVYNNISVSTTSVINDYNCPVQLINSGATSTGNFTVTSNREVRITNDFISATGSDFQAKITPAICNGSPNAFAARTANYSNSAVNEIDEQKNTITIQSNDFNVIPNPSSGNFKVQLNTDMPLPNSIAVINYLGVVIYKLNKPQSYEVEINIANAANGLYSLNANYGDKIVSKKIVKN